MPPRKYYPRSCFLILLHAWYRLRLIWLYFHAIVYDKLWSSIFSPTSLVQPSSKKKSFFSNSPSKSSSSFTPPCSKLKQLSYEKMPDHFAFVTPSLLQWGPYQFLQPSSSSSSSLQSKFQTQVLQAILLCSQWVRLKSLSVLFVGETEPTTTLDLLKSHTPYRTLHIHQPLHTSTFSSTTTTSTSSSLSSSHNASSTATLTSTSTPSLNPPSSFPSTSSSLIYTLQGTCPLNVAPPLPVYFLTPQEHGKSLIVQFAKKFPTHGLEYLSELFPDPDLLVIPYPSLTLLGYPPWHLRLTEIYHEEGLTQLSLGLILRSLDRYQKVQHRYGR